MAVVAAGFYPALRAPRVPRAALLALFSSVILAVPILIGRGPPLLRCVASIMAVTLVVKLFDLHVGASPGDLPGLIEFLAFLPNVFGLVHRRLDKAPRVPVRDDLRRLVLRVPPVLAATALLLAAFSIDWESYPFWPEHAIKVVVFFLFLVPLANMASAVWRLAGGRGLNFMDNPFAARTPADFWRRYNRPVHEFLQHDVFVPAGGHRRPAVGAFAVFLASAAIHEYVFSVPLRRVQGYQTAFFLLQGVAVAATLRAKPRGMTAAACVAATFTFNVATAVLFFASVNRVIPIYRHPVPLWDEPPAERRVTGEPECCRAYASNPDSAAKGGRSNRRIESSSSVVGRSATLATRWFGVNQTTLCLKFSSSKHRT
jgi:hypothetical protein